MKTKSKKKMPMFLYAIIMTVVFFALTQGVIWGYASDVIMDAIDNAPKSELVISEAILAFLVLIVMLLFKNQYVFTEKGEKFLPSLRYGVFYIIFACMFISLNGGDFGSMPIGGVINLIRGCFLVGIAEEFLCRGWLLNEFLERYGNTKKGIWASIIISGVIFGIMHIGNYINGGELWGTVTQILSAAATGIFLGVIYYRTKNIWATVALHGLWDFSLFLSELAPIEEMQPDVSTGVLGVVVGVILAFAELINLKPYLKNISAKIKFGEILKYALFALGAFILGLSLQAVIMFSKVDEGNNYKYDNLALEEYAITKANYSEYYLDNGDVSIKLSKNDKDQLTLTNMTSKQFVEFDEDITYYMIVENSDKYVLGYIYYDKDSNAFLKYIYISKEDISNSYQFLNDTKTNMKSYLIKPAYLYVLSDHDNSYLTAYNRDYGYFVLVEDGKMAILNRD